MRRQGRVLQALLLSLVVHAAEVREDAPDLHVIAAMTGGGNLVDIDPGVQGGRQTGPVLGVRGGFRASIPPARPGGARVGMMPVLGLRYEPLGGRAEWFGSAALTLTLHRLIITVSAGYGLSSVHGGDPRSFVSVGNSLSMSFGGLLLGILVDTTFRIGGGGFVGRTLEVSATAGWQFELFD